MIREGKPYSYRALSWDFDLSTQAPLCVKQSIGRTQRMDLQDVMNCLHCSPLLQAVNFMEKRSFNHYFWHIHRMLSFSILFSSAIHFPAWSFALSIFPVETHPRITRLDASSSRSGSQRA